MADCIFCKIIQKEIPSRIVYQDEHVTAFLDNSQATAGHTLLVPNQHVENLFEYDSELAGQVFSRLPILAKAIKASNPDVKGMNILQNNGSIAYQTVFHSHIHLIPRYQEDEGFKISMENNGDRYSDEELDQIMQSIQKQLED